MDCQENERICYLDFEGLCKRWPPNKDRAHAKVDRTARGSVGHDRYDLRVAPAPHRDCRPYKLATLLLCVAPKPVPLMVTLVPNGPTLGEMFVTVSRCSVAAIHLKGHAPIDLSRRTGAIPSGKWAYMGYHPLRKAQLA
jgi:hypothetical protein